MRSVEGIMNLKMQLNISRMVCLAVALILLTLRSVPIHAESQEGSVHIQKESIKDTPMRFSMEFSDADLKDILRAIGQENDLNIIISEDVEGKLTLSFKNISLEDAFDAILKSNNLMAVEEGGIIRVFESPFKEGEENMITRIIPINFADVKESQMMVKSFLSKQGSLSVDIRTNTLIVRDIPEIVNRIEGILNDLDTRTPQVLIEARIVEASDNFARELGVQWGGSFVDTRSDGTFRATGAGGETGPLTGGTGLSGDNFVVNLPASVGPGAGGAMGFTFGSLDGTVQLDLQLSAMEDTGNGRILSKPSILALDNKEAKISSGTEILIPVTTITTGISTGTIGTAGGSTTSGVTTINAKLELAVTPHVTSNDLIVIHIKADKKEPDFNRTVQGIPPLTSRTAETDLLVKNGETIVIGGIQTRNESVSQQGVPFLSKIPLLGWLFKRETRRDDKSELLIFITPTIQPQAN
jgi:type IV pilus assembly protein PilQ